MNVVMIIGICICATVICKILEKDNRELRFAVVLSAAVVAAGKIIISIGEITEVISKLFNRAGMDSDYLVIMFKALGICYIVQLACDCCKDNGEQCLSSQIEMAGRVSLLIISLPLFNGVIIIIEALDYIVF